MKQNIASNKDLVEYYKRDHATVKYSVEAIDDLIEFNKGKRKRVLSCMFSVTNLAHIVDNPFSNFSL